MSSKSDLPKFVKKKDGHVVKFDKTKIERSIGRSLQHVGEWNDALAKHIADQVCSEIRGEETVDAEKIRFFVKAELRKHKLARAIPYYDMAFLRLKTRIKKVIKRDGSKETFDPHKIFKSMLKATHMAGIHDGKQCEKMTKEVVLFLNKKYGSKAVPSSEIRDAVEYVLERHKLHKVLRAYTTHRYM